MRFWKFTIVIRKPDTERVFPNSLNLTQALANFIGGHWENGVSRFPSVFLFCKRLTPLEQYQPCLKDPLKRKNSELGKLTVFNSKRYCIFCQRRKNSKKHHCLCLRERGNRHREKTWVVSSKEIEQNKAERGVEPQKQQRSRTLKAPKLRKQRVVFIWDNGRAREGVPVLTGSIPLAFVCKVARDFSTKFPRRESPHQSGFLFIVY